MQEKVSCKNLFCAATWAKLYLSDFPQGEVSLPVGMPVFILAIASFASLGGSVFVTIAFFSAVVNVPLLWAFWQPGVIKQTPTIIKKNATVERIVCVVLFAVIFMALIGTKKGQAPLFHWQGWYFEQSRASKVSYPCLPWRSLLRTISA